MSRLEPGLVWIVVVHFGAAQPTLACLESIASDPSRVRRRVMVVDNSGDLPEHRLPSGVEILACPDNPGFGGGVHRGLEALAQSVPAEGVPAEDVPQVLLALNHDVELAPGFLDACLELFANEPTVGAAGGPIYRHHLGGELWYAGGELRRLTGTLRQSRSARDAARPRDVGFIPGAAMAIRPAAWNAVGGFDPSIFLYHEDLDLCLRLARAGWRLRFAPGLAVLHQLGEASGSGEASAFYLEQLSATRFLPFKNRLYRLYLALVHSVWVAMRAARWALAGDWQRVLALLRGHRRALAGAIGRRNPRSTSASPSKAVQSSDD